MEKYYNKEKLNIFTHKKHIYIGLPFWLGDTVYWVNKYGVTPSIEEHKCLGFQITMRDTYVQIDIGTFVPLNEISITKPEAEQKLKELQK